MYVRTYKEGVTIASSEALTGYRSCMHVSLACCLNSDYQTGHFTWKSEVNYVLLGFESTAQRLWLPK